MYNRQVFSSTADFVQAFDNGTLEIEHIPDIDPAWTTRVRKGDPRDLDDKAGPRAVSFAGHRFRVDTDQRYVSWMGWDFYLGFDRDMACDDLECLSSLTYLCNGTGLVALEYQLFE